MPAPTSLENAGIPVLLLSWGGFGAQPFTFPQVASWLCLRARACLCGEENKTKPTTLHFWAMNVHFRTFGHISWGGWTTTTKQRNKILNNVLVKPQPPAYEGAGGTPELLPRDLPCHPGPYQPVVAATLREVGCFQPFSAQLHQALFAGGGSPLPCSTAGVPSSPLGQHPSLAEQSGPGARGLGCLSFPLCCGLCVRRKMRSTPVSPQWWRAGPSYGRTFGREKAKVAPSQLGDWKRNTGHGGQHFRSSD